MRDPGSLPFRSNADLNMTCLEFNNFEMGQRIKSYRDADHADWRRFFSWISANQRLHLHLVQVQVSASSLSLELIKFKRLKSCRKVTRSFRCTGEFVTVNRFGATFDLRKRGGGFGIQLMGHMSGSVFR